MPEDAHISLTLPDGEIKRFSLQIDLIRIGRAPDNTIVLDDASLSSHHCALTKDGESFTIEDLDSTNGLELNGNEITKHTLEHGDIVKMGEIMLTYETAGSPEVEPSPPAVSEVHEDFLIAPGDDDTPSDEPATPAVAKGVHIEDEDEDTTDHLANALAAEEEDDESTAAQPATPAPTRAAQTAYTPQKSGGGFGGFIVSLFVVVISALIGLSIAHYRATGGILPLDLLDQLQK